MYFFLQLLVIKTLDPDWIRIRICVRIHLKSGSGHIALPKTLRTVFYL